MFKKKYRIVEDNYGGYEAQFRRFFIWRQCFGTNTSSSIERALRIVKVHSKNVVWKSGDIMNKEKFVKQKAKEFAVKFGGETYLQKEFAKAIRLGMDNAYLNDVYRIEETQYDYHESGVFTIKLNDEQISAIWYGESHALARFEAQEAAGALIEFLREGGDV